MALGDVLARNETPSTREIEALRQQLRWASASLIADEQIGGALLKDYERVLQER
jgi:cell division FtsZ-interacting protein ZapD